MMAIGRFEMEFGPEIKVDGIRPEWLDGYDGPVRWWNEDQPHGITCPDARVLNWGPYTGRKHGSVTSFALPANHPHYQQNTPTPDERAVDIVLYERMTELTKRIANPGSVDHNKPGYVSCIDEARAIVAALEPVVDEDEAEAEAIMAMDEYKGGNNHVKRAVLAAIKRGRALASRDASRDVTPCTREQFEDACRV